MNVLQAIKKMDDLKDDIDALSLAMSCLHDKKADSHMIQCLTEMRANKLKFRNELMKDLEAIKMPKQY